MSSHSKLIDAVISAATAQGWRHSRTTSGHHQFYSPNKQDIIVTSGTPSDARAMDNFLAAMKRAGYVDCAAVPAKHSIADKLRAALAAPLPESPAKRLTLPQIVIGFLERHARAASIEDIAIVAKYHRPTLQRTTLLHELARLADEGRIQRIGRGLYSALREEPKAQEQHRPSPAGAFADQSRQLMEPSQACHCEGEAEAELAEIDSALAALERTAALLSRRRAALLARKPPN